MNCTWCEEEGEMIDYCNIEGHRVCQVCYEKYKNAYPNRLEGCPYCKGNQEKMVIYIHSENQVVAESVIQAANAAIDQRNTIVIYYEQDYEYEKIISIIIITVIILLLAIYSLSKTTFYT